jgi:hypothetical protein
MLFTDYQYKEEIVENHRLSHTLVPPTGKITTLLFDQLVVTSKEV